MLTIDTGNTVTNAGLFEATSGGILQIDDTIANSGSILADGGTVVVAGTVTANNDTSGSATIEASGTLEIGATDAQVITFNGAGMLILDHQDEGDFSGTVGGFGAGDTIDLKALGYSGSGESAAWTQTSDAGGVLTISNGTQSESVNLAGTHSASDFALTSDGSGDSSGTDLISSPIGLSVSVVDNLAVQEGQTLVAQATLDAADAGATASYQWQSSSDNGLTWHDVSGAVTANYNGGLVSLLQLTEADEGDLFRAEASFTNSSDQLVTATSTPTTKVADVTPVITAPFSYTVDDLSIVKNGTEIYNDTFSQAPPDSPEISSSSGPAPVAFLTLGSTWTDNGSGAVMSSTGLAPDVAVSGVYDDFALLNTNTDPTSSSGLKEAAAFTVSSTFGLTADPVGNYGMELNDGSSMNAPDQDVRLIVTSGSNRSTVVELVQSDPAADTSAVLAEQTLTPAQLAANTQIEFQLSHAVNTTAVTGTFELLADGTVTDTQAFTPTGTIFTTEGFTRVDVGAFVDAGVALNVGAGQSPREGDTLTASATTNDPDAAIGYQWQDSSDGGTTWTSISGAILQHYTLGETDEGDEIRVVATTSDPDNASTTATSVATGVVFDALPTVTVPVISGTAEEGDTLTASASAGQNDNPVTYQWMEDNGPGGTYQNISGASGSTYNVQASDEGFQIEVVATATNDNGVTTSETSAPTAIVPAAELTDEWLNTNGGSWTDAANASTNWGNGALPRSIDEVLIDESGTYTVTIASGASAVASSLTLNSANATLSDQGSLTLNGALTIDAGTFQLADGGTFNGATAITNAGTFEIAEAFTLATPVTNTNGTVQVDAGDTLTLAGGSISGGAIDLGQGSEQIQSVSEISVPGSNSYAPVMSGNGGVIVFEASDSLPGANSNGGSIELYNASSGQVTNISALVDQHSGETFGNIPSISSDGNDVVFTGDYQFTNDYGTFQTSDVLLYNAQTQQVTVAYSNAGHAVISGNGQFIAAEANSPFTGTPHGQSVVVTDQSGDLLTQITGDPSYVLPNDQSDHFGNIGSAYDPAISGNGRYVTFWSTSSIIAVTQGNATSTFATGNTTGTTDNPVAEVYLYDRQTNTLQEVSGVLGGLQGNGDSGTLSIADHHDNDWASSLSSNGRYVVFQSDASNLAGNTTPGDSNIFLYDSWTHTTQLVSAGVGGEAADGASYRPAISADGDYVSFSSTATDLVAGGTDGTAKTYVYDTQTGTLQLASAAADGTPADGESDLASTLSSNGSIVAYGGVAENLGPNTNPGSANIFVDNLNQTPSGALDVTADTTITGGATVNGGTVTVEAGATLTLDGVAINGSTIDLAQGTETVQSTTEISAPPFNSRSAPSSAPTAIMLPLSLRRICPGKATAMWAVASNSMTPRLVKSPTYRRLFRKPIFTIGKPSTIFPRSAPTTVTSFSRAIIRSQIPSLNSGRRPTRNRSFSSTTAKLHRETR